MNRAALPDSPPPYGTVAFDCDSTLAHIEGIDELAGARKPEIAKLTERAMRGEIALEDVYRVRLELLRPTRAAIAALGKQYVATRVEFARELCDALRSLEKRAVIVSGGVRGAVLELARSLAIDPADVRAVEVFHDARGEYAGFDERSPLATTRGKFAIVAELSAADPRGVAFVGEGVTDLFAAPAAKRFIAFGGVVRRAEVFAAARVTSLGPNFAALVPHLFTPAEIERLRTDRAHRALLEAAQL